MKKLSYITYDPFLILDFPIVKELNKQYDLTWFVIFKLSSKQYTVEDIQKFADENNISIKFLIMNKRYRSLRHCYDSFVLSIVLKKLASDLYYFQSFSDTYLPIFAWLFLGTRKTIVAVHNVEEHLKDDTLLRRIVKSFYLKVFKNFHIYSEHQKNIFIKRYPQKNIMMVRLCLHDYGRAKKKSDPDKTHFLFFGVIHYYKGVDYLIEAANLLSNDTDRFSISIVGNCDDFEPLRSKIAKVELFNLHIGVIPHNEVAQFFADADYLVLPYRDVTQSGPLKIAYNYGIPVIASDLEGFHEYIVDRKTGYLFEANNSFSLYEVMRTVVNEKKEERKETKKALAQFIKRELELGSIIKGYVSSFEKIIAYNKQA